MQLPGPVRAAVGLAASAADNAKHLPDRAIELPMLAVSTALQVSLRAQQRYARLTARGDQALSRRKTGDEPPEWATFDEPVTSDERHSVPAPGSSAGEAAQLLDQLFGAPSDNGAPGPATKATAQKATAQKATAKKATAKKATAKKATATKATAAREPAAKRTNTARASGTSGKGVSKPRHTAPSRFDDVGDAGVAGVAGVVGDAADKPADTDSD